jgi:hypothetical protein
VAFVDPECSLSDLTSFLLSRPEGQCLLGRVGRPLRLLMSPASLEVKATGLLSPTQQLFHRRPPGDPAPHIGATVEPRPAVRRAGCLWGLLRSHAVAAGAARVDQQASPLPPELTLLLSRQLC